MWFLPALPAQNVVLPPNTPIPCLVCKAGSASTLTFSGIVQVAQPGWLRVFNGKSHQTMEFVVPADFHNVESSDGKIKNAPVTRVPPGLLSRVTYRTVNGQPVITHVLLLTILQCRALMAAERLSNTRSECPD